MENIMVIYVPVPYSFDEYKSDPATQKTIEMLKKAMFIPEIGFLRLTDELGNEFKAWVWTKKI